MGLIITPESELGKELAKHEQFPGRITDTPGNPYVFRPYPRMLYKAHKKVNGKVVCLDVQPAPWEYDHLGPAASMAFDRACRETDRINALCSIIAQSDAEYEKYRSQGWCDTQDDAIARHEAFEQEIGNAAAEAAHQAQGMSSKAKGEIAAADASTHEHVTDVTGTPKARRGRAAAKHAHAVTGKGK